MKCSKLANDKSLACLTFLRRCGRLGQEWVLRFLLGRGPPILVAVLVIVVVIIFAQIISFLAAAALDLLRLVILDELLPDNEVDFEVSRVRGLIRAHKGFPYPNSHL